MTPIDARAYLADVLDAWVHPRQIMFRTQADLEALAARLTEGAAAVETVKRVWAKLRALHIAGLIDSHAANVLITTLNGPPQPDAAQVAEPPFGDEFVLYPEHVRHVLSALAALLTTGHESEPTPEPDPCDRPLRPGEGPYACHDPGLGTGVAHFAPCPLAVPDVGAGQEERHG